MTIEVWYDNYTKSWVVMLLDDKLNQIGEADYIHSKNEALKIVEDLKREYEINKIKFFNRNDGSLQKQIIL